MRTLIVVSLALVSCSKKLETKRSDRLFYKDFSVPVPAGWNEVTDRRITGKAQPGGHVIMLVDAPSGFQPSIYIQELELGPNDHKQLLGATVETCRDVVGKQMVEITKTTLGAVRVADFSGYKGCDIELVDPTSDQSARQISVSNGKLAVSITCNRDKKGAPAVDAACATFPNNISVE
jgi:hypothetical protein